MRKRIVTAILLLFLSASAYSQSGIRAVDYNTLSTGRGGTEIGFFDSPSLMITNPAGMSFIKKPVLNANTIFMVPIPHFKNYSKDATGKTTTNIYNDYEGEKVLYALPSLSYVHNFENSNLTLGAGVFTTGGMGTDYKLKHQLLSPTADNQKYRSRFAIVESAISAAYLITPKLSIGATGEFVYSTLEIVQPFSLPPSLLKGTLITTSGPTTFGNYFSAPRPAGLGYSEMTAAAEMTGLKSYTFGGKFGIAYKYSERFSIGANYCLSIPLNFKSGTASLDMSSQFSEASGIAAMNLVNIYHISIDSAAKLVSALFSANGIHPYEGFTATYDVENEFKTPQSAGFGLMYSPIPRLRFGFDFEWLNWSKAFENMKLTLKNGNNNNVNKMIGSGGINQGDLIVEFPLKWKDAVILKFGGEYDFSEVFTLRAGYAYTTNPIPPETIIPIMPAVLEHHVMAGFSYNLLAKLKLHMGLEYGFNNTVTGSSIHQVATEYNNSESSLKNLLGHISLTYNFK
ncbi:MAG TPA: outer membrane protein transport protein [Ignavibacteria bacterium]|nr:outer membrane protein transport protein [Ignavibacteria bacterium]